MPKIEEKITKKNVMLHVRIEHSFKNVICVRLLFKVALVWISLGFGNISVWISFWAALVEQRTTKKLCVLLIDMLLLPENLVDLVKLVQMVAQFHHKIPTIDKHHSVSLQPQKYLSYFDSIKENSVNVFFQCGKIYSLVKISFFQNK